MKSTIRLILVVIALFALAMPALAGRLKKVWEDKGQVSVELFDDVDGRQKIHFRGLPTTADRTPGPAVMRFNGVYIAQWLAPTYEFEISADAGFIPALKGDPDKDGQLYIPWLKSDPNQRVDLRRLTVGINTVEIYFLSKDEKGRFDRSRSAAPATHFRVEETDPPVAATTTSGQPMTPAQLDDAIKQSYEQGFSAGKDAGAKERELGREQLLSELRKATNELNQLRKDKASAQTKTPFAVRYVPVAWKEKVWPDPKEDMVLTRKGVVITSAEIVEIFPQASRLWVKILLPVDFVIDGDCRVERPKDRKGN